MARDRLLPAALAIAAALIAYHALVAGTWLDEYWQVYVSGAPGSELSNRLFADAHPPWFNLLARPLLALGDGAIIPARLLSLAGALLLLALGLRALGDLEPALRWRIALLAVASAGPIGLSELGVSLRAYPWLIALATLQAAILLLAAERRTAPFLATVAVTAASIALHYVHAAGAIAIALVTAFLAWRAGNRLLLKAVGLGLVLGVVLDLATGLTQLPAWRVNADANWIALTGGTGKVAIAESLIAIIFFNLVATGLIAFGVMRSRGRAPWLWLFAPMPLAMTAWLLLDAIVPSLIPRYTVALTALWAVAAAAAWGSLGLGKSVSAMIALFAALQPLFALILRPPMPGWEVGAQQAAALGGKCPTTKLLSVSAWRFRERPDSNAAAFEAPVFRLGYEHVGARFGLRPQFVDRPVAVTAAACPTIVWIEAAHGLAEADPQRVLRLARITVPSGSAVRPIATPNGALLVVTPLPNLQTLPLQGGDGRR